jgi:threonine synthase
MQRTKTSTADREKLGGFRRSLRCVFCGSEYETPPDREDERLEHRLQCTRPSCVARHRGIYGSLEVTYDYEAIRNRVDLKKLFSTKGESMWHFEQLLPVRRGTSLEEGSTPLVRSERLSSQLGIADSMLKYEGTNPTGSFKDRESAVVVSRALEVGARAVTCVSCGNAAASLASYAAHAGVSCLVFTPSDAEVVKRKVIEYTGAKLVTVDGIFEDVWELVNRSSQEDLSVSSKVYSLFYDCNPGLNPYRSEGDKTTAYEIFAQAHSVPDWVVVPVGNGSDLAGIWKGFKELVELGLADSTPKMLGVQILGADPVAEAWRRGKADSVRVEHPVDSMADGIVAKDSYDAPRALMALKESDGAMVSVTDGESLDELFACARDEGLLVEPTSATALAAGKEMREAGRIGADERVVFVMTGSGFKSIDAMVKKNVTDRVARLYDEVASAVEPLLLR